MRVGLYDNTKNVRGRGEGLSDPTKKELDNVREGPPRAIDLVCFYAHIAGKYTHCPHTPSSVVFRLLLDL